MNELSACPVCGGSARSARLLMATECREGRGGSLSIRLVECPCGHAFVNPQPSWEELAPFYPEGYHAYGISARDLDGLDRMIAADLRGDRLKHARVAKGGRYLDIGCGSGYMVAMMARLGVDAEGVEPSATGADRSRRWGVKIFHGTLQQARFPDETFDSMSMYHSLEHMPDPVAVLAECRRILKPDGELFVGVPNFDSLVRAVTGWVWGGIDLPRHLHHFRMASIERAAARAGLRVVQADTESFPAHVESELASFLRRRAFVPARLTLNARLGRPLARYLAARGCRTGRGEALNIHLRRADS